MTSTNNNEAEAVDICCALCFLRCGIGEVDDVKLKQCAALAIEPYFLSLFHYQTYERR